MSLLQEALFIGIDGGGTKCRAQIFSADGEALGVGVGAEANAYLDEQKTKESIHEAALNALTDAQLPAHRLADLIAGVGLAGVNVQGVYARMNAWSHPFKAMHLTTDLRIACMGAHCQENGAVIIAGTGSCGYSIVNQHETLIGGHGFLLGDQGSGAWMGVEAVKAALLAQDALASPTCLVDLIAQHLHVRPTHLVDALTGATSKHYAQIAQCVFDAVQMKDAVALAIVHNGADYLNEVARKLWQTNPGRLSMMGGLTEAIRPWLANDVLAFLSEPLRQPEFGAYMYARQASLR